MPDPKKMKSNANYGASGGPGGPMFKPRDVDPRPRTQPKIAPVRPLDNVIKSGIRTGSRKR